MSVHDSVGTEVSTTFSNLAITSNDTICDTCRKIDFKKLTKSPSIYAELCYLRASVSSQRHGTPEKGP
jgi:hypothetical protein